LKAKQKLLEEATIRAADESTSAQQAIDGLKGSVEELRRQSRFRKGKDHTTARVILTRGKSKSISPLPSPIPMIKLRPAISKRKSKRTSAGRRKILRWGPEEVECLHAGVEKYGIGRWKEILEDRDFIFHHRTTVDLKDKYRNILKYGN